MPTSTNLSPLQKKIKGSLIEDPYTFREFLKDWKHLELGGREETLPFLGIALILIGLSPGGLSYLTRLTHVDLPVIILIGLLGIGACTWFAGASLFSTFLQRNRAKTIVHFENFKSSIPPPSTEDDLLIGYTTDKMLPFRIPNTILMRHGYVPGMTSVGKTSLARSMMFQQIQKGGGVINIDGKLDSTAYRDIYSMAVLCGRRDDFLIINPGDPSLSNTYNPILFGGPDEVTQNIMTLIASTEGDSAFYRGQSIQALTTIIGALQCLGKAYCFMDIVTLLMSEPALIYLYTLLSEEPYRSDARSAAFFLWIEQYKQLLSQDGQSSYKVNMNNLKKNLGGLSGELFKFATGQFGDVMNSYDPEINLFEDILANKIIYVALPTMGKAEAASALGKLFIGDFRTAISKIQALPEHERPGWVGNTTYPARRPFFAFFDEVGSYAIDNMDKIFEQGRSAGLACFAASQTFANLEKVSKEFKNQVIGNTWTKIFFKIAESDTSSDIAELIGMTRRGVRNEGQTISESEGAMSLQANPQSQANRAQNEQNVFRETEEYLVSPDQLKALSVGECVVYYGGIEAYHLKIPLVTITPAGFERVGPFQIIHKKIRKVNGTHLYEKMVKLINKEMHQATEEGRRVA